MAAAAATAPTATPAVTIVNAGLDVLGDAFDVLLFSFSFGLAGFGCGQLFGSACLFHRSVRAVLVSPATAAAPAAAAALITFLTACFALGTGAFAAVGSVSLVLEGAFLFHFGLRLGHRHRLRDRNRCLTRHLDAQPFDAKL